MRSLWTLGILALLLGLHGASLNLPWYSYTHSSGRTLPPEFPSNETGENVTRIEYYPFQVRGDANDTQQAEAAPHVERVGLAVSTSLALVLLAFGIELLWGQREWARWPGMVLGALGCVVAAAALAYAWYQLPILLAEEGVNSTFTNRQVSDGYVRSTLEWGWVVGGLAVVAHMAHFAFRYQQGSLDLSFIERFRRRP